MVISEKRKEYMRAYREANKEKIKEYNKAYREANKEKIKVNKKAYQKANKEKIKENKKAHYEAYKEKIKSYREANLEKTKEYRKANKEKINARHRAWRKTNPERARALYKKANDKILSTPEGRLIHSMRSRIHKVIKINHKIINKHTLELLDCDGEFLKNHLEKQFSKGMSWGNYGEWHVDHIIPIDFFIKNHDFNNIEVQKECFNYSNLQPLWAVENIKKRNKTLD